MNDYDVILRLDFDAGTEAVETLALRALDVVERYAADVALGPVVGGTADPPAIELEFDVVAASGAEAHERIAHVLGIIERHAGLRAVRRASIIEREPVAP